MGEFEEKRRPALRVLRAGTALGMALLAGAAQAGQEAARPAALGDESAQLVTLTVALKAEVDKTNKNMLSLKVIRGAEAIEKLAHRMRTRAAGAGN